MQASKKHVLEAVSVPNDSPAKTVADCFKYRNTIGLDVVIEAFRECRRSQRCSMDDLWRCGGICRVQNVMRPLLEGVVG